MKTLTCPIDLDSPRLRREVTEMYSRIATTPDGTFQFHRGPQYAVDWLGYVLVRTYDCFRGTSKERTARKYGVRGAVLSAIRA